MKAKSAKTDLKIVFDFIHREKYWFSAKSRSVDEVIRVYAAGGTPKSTDEAERFIIDGVLSLDPKNFYDRDLQWGMVVDIYGLIYDGRHWYVKLGIDEQENEDGTTEPWLQEISFHPPDRAFTTQGGIEISAGG